MTLPEEDVDVGTTSSPSVGVSGVTLDVFDTLSIVEVVGEEIKVSSILEDCPLYSRKIFCFSIFFCRSVTHRSPDLPHPQVQLRRQTHMYREISKARVETERKTE
jgi:hypothetical protein